MGLFGSLGAGGGQQVKELLIMEAYDWTELGALKVWVKNVGAANIVLGDLFVNGLTVNYILPGQCDNTISIQQSCRIIINQFALTITLGASYVLKIVAVNGAVFSYSVTAGRTG